MPASSSLYSDRVNHFVSCAIDLNESKLTFMIIYLKSYSKGIRHLLQAASSTHRQSITHHEVASSISGSRSIKIKVHVCNIGIIELVASDHHIELRRRWRQSNQPEIRARWGLTLSSSRYEAEASQTTGNPTLHLLLIRSPAIQLRQRGGMWPLSETCSRRRRGSRSLPSI